MRSEKRSLAINEVKEVLKSELVTKVCGGRIWIEKTVNKDEIYKRSLEEEVE